jgi:hypothetical protein
VPIFTHYKNTAIADGQGSAWSTKTQYPHSQPHSYPYYAHPLSSENTSSRIDLTARRPSVHAKLSRGQIANFRKASASASADSTAPPSNYHHSCISKRPHSRHLEHNHSRPYSASASTSTFGSTSRDSRTSSTDLTPTPRSYHHLAAAKTPKAHTHLPYLETRRHLASSRSTAEMKGRSPTTPTRDKVSKDGPSFDSSTPHPQPGHPLPHKHTHFPFVCPEKLIQKPRPQ